MLMVGKTPVSPFISLEICFVIPVRLAFLCEESFSEQAVAVWCCRKQRMVPVGY